MSRLSKTFRVLAKEKEHALIGFVTCGDPSPKDTVAIVDSLVRGGIDILELGLAFSDPIADGLTIQKASQRSLEKGMTPDRFFKTAREIDKKHKIPKVCLTYYNLILQRGLKRFAKDCSESGIDGIIVPDLPIEESKELKGVCKKRRVDLIYLVAPTTTDERLKKIAKKSSGFIYVVSLLGVTGARDKLSTSVGPLIKKLKKISKVPLAVGFGISKPRHVKEIVKAGADGTIVGSAFIQIIEKNLKNRKKMLKELERFAKKLKEATKR